MKRRFAILLALLLMTAPLTACGSLPNGVSGLLGNNDGDKGVGYAENGCVEGCLGDTMHTAFFDFTINSAYTCMEFDGLTPEDGYKFLVTELTLYNNTKYTQPMYFWDFQVQWDVRPSEGEEKAAALPLYEEIQDENGEPDYISVSDLQLPTFYDLDINETRTGILLYAVPESAESYSISFQEYVLTDEGEEELGDLFFVWFDAEEK